MIYFETTLREFLAERAIAFDDDMIEKASRYAAYLLEENQKINLTAIVDEAEMAVKHFGDSLLLLNYADLPRGCRIADIGSGAGFPGMVLKIFRPDLDMTLIDSLGKRCLFLERLRAELGLDDVVIGRGRAEDLGREAGLREAFDAVTARAVAPLPTLLEYATPFLRPGGRFFALKGHPEEADPAFALAELNCELAATDRYTVNDEERSILTVVKTGPTAERYPRRAGIPEKRPLR